MRANRYGDQRQILAAVADTNIQIVSPTKRFFLIVDPLVGTASQFWLTLPDARTIRIGTPFHFENKSSEFVGVMNSDKTTYCIIPPGCILECVLKTQATAAGVWFSCPWENTDSSKLLHLAVDFSGVIASSIHYSEMGLSAGVSVGTNSIHTTLGTMPGVWKQAVTALNSYALSYAFRYLLLGGGPSRLTFLTSFQALSTAAEEFIGRLGFHNNITGGAPTDAVYLLYNRAASGNFYITKTIAAAGGITENVSAVQPSTTLTAPDRLEIEVNSTATRADFIANKTKLFTHSVAANIPTTVAAFPNFGMTKTAVTADASRSMNTDYVDFIKAFTTPR